MKKVLFFIGLGVLGLSSCIEHEVIPAPTPQVDLYAHFIGIIDGAEVEFVQNSMGYQNESSKDLYIFQTNSKAVYRSTMSSDAYDAAITVGHGSVYFGGGNTEPTVAQFNNFFADIANQTPDYSNTGLAGIFVHYTDGTGRVWASDSTLTVTSFSYGPYKQGSDNTGDYHVFEANFDCQLTSERPLEPGVYDTLLVQNAVYNGWYRR